MTGMAMSAVISTQKISFWAVISFMAFISHLSLQEILKDNEKKIKYCPQCGLNIKDKELFYNEL